MSQADIDTLITDLTQCEIQFSESSIDPFFKYNHCEEISSFRFHFNKLHNKVIDNLEILSLNNSFLNKLERFLKSYQTEETADGFLLLITNSRLQFFSDDKNGFVVPEDRLNLFKFAEPFIKYQREQLITLNSELQKASALLIKQNDSEDSNLKFRPIRLKNGISKTVFYAFLKSFVEEIVDEKDEHHNVCIALAKSFITNDRRELSVGVLEKTVYGNSTDITEKHFDEAVEIATHIIQTLKKHRENLHK